MRAFLIVLLLYANPLLAGGLDWTETEKQIYRHEEDLWILELVVEMRGVQGLVGVSSCTDCDDTFLLDFLIEKGKGSFRRETRLLDFLIGEGMGLKGMDRPSYRNGTAGSVKWELSREITKESPKWDVRHSGGCAWNAPDWVCICLEVRDEYRRKHGMKDEW